MLVLLINTCGYRFIISAMQENSDRQFDTSLDNNEYDESQLIEIKVAMNMPYQERFTDFERHYGQIEMDGKSYTYVKRKIDGDVVIFKCIANESREQLKKINSDMTQANASNNANMDHSGKQQQPSSFAKSMLGDFDDQQFSQLALASVLLQEHQYNSYSFYIPQITVNPPHQPPKC